MKLRCQLFGHNWGKWHSPVHVIKNDGLDTNVTEGSQRKCSRCNEWDTKVEQ